MIRSIGSSCVRPRHRHSCFATVAAAALSSKRSSATTPPSQPASPPSLSSHASWASKSRALYPASLATRAAGLSAATLAQRRNIFLMGSPGSGKSSVGRHLAKLLSMPLIDVDDDVLEPNWKCSVAQKLAAVGDIAFLEAEGSELSKLSTVTGHIISLSGSNPLNSAAMATIIDTGVVVYLDCPHSHILNRMHSMKVDRIVGQSSRSLSEILAYRNNIYEQCYDLRIDIADNDSPPMVAERIAQSLRASHEFVSTRGYANNLEITDVIKAGLAPDRGLFIPRYDELRPMTSSEIARLSSMSYAEIALRVMERIPLGSLHPSILRSMMHSAYQTFDTDAVLPVNNVSENLYAMEMFHGPTNSFKDLSLQLLPRLLTHCSTLSHDSAQVGLLVATSGDTGTAALDGFSRSTNNPVVVLYPRHGVSAVQRKQMVATSGDNVLVLGVEGDFDYCQTTVKDLFNDPAVIEKWRHSLPSLSLSSANSMNFGRFLPQIVFSFVAYARLVKRGVISVGDSVDVCVPTGNFGNLLGCVYARHLGLPLRRLIAASNENNIIHDFIQGGRYDLRQRTFHATHSPSIDILVSSNLERFLHLCSDGDTATIRIMFESLSKNGWFAVDRELHDRVRASVQSGWCSGAECLATIKQVYANTNIVIDPHTAVGVKVANEFRDDNVPMLVASTAHYAKFPHAVLAALKDEAPSMDASIDELFAALNSIQPRSKLSYIPESLTRLASAAVVNDHTCPADRHAIELAITEFFQTLPSARSSAQSAKAN